MCPGFAKVDPLYEIAGRAYNIPTGYEIIRWDITNEELENLVLTRDTVFQDAAKVISKKYNIKTWVGINQLVNVSLSEWLGLTEDPFIRHYGYPDIVMRAVAMEVEDLSNELDKKRKDQELRMKELVQKPALDALSASAPNSALSKVFR
jgi:hypothetical protein